MKFSPSDFEAACRDLPAVLSVELAAKALHVPRKTIYQWSSAGRLDACARRRGKRLLILRDKFFQEIFNGNNW
jgi:excisionase family DNA binding protein